MKILESLGQVADRLLPVEASRVSMDTGTQELLDYYASIQGRTADWIFAPIRSASQDVGRSLRRIRGNARELTRDNPYAHHYRGLVADNVIGPDGMSYRAQVRAADGLTLDRDVNRTLEDAWKRWAEDRRAATVDHSGGWPDVERLLVDNMVTDGEGLLRHYPGFRNAFGYAVQVLDPDQLDDSMMEPVGNGVEGTNGREIRFGVEIDKWGAPAAYWLFPNHPSEAGGRMRRIRIPAAQISLHYVRHRAGQPRGLSWFQPILSDVKMLGGYQEAELVAARTAAAKMGFFKRDPEAVTAPDTVRGRAPSLKMSAKPGQIHTLPVGYSFEGWDPTHPNTAYSAFVKGNIRSIAAGLRVGYNTLAQDLEGVNFSSLRQGNLQERDVWRVLQGLTIRTVHLDVHAFFVRQGILSGALGELPTRRSADYMARKFIPRGWAWVDPQKEGKADAEAVANFFDSRTAIVARRTGRQFEDVVEELREEKELIEAAGLTITPPSTGGGNDGQGDDAEDQDGNGGGDGEADGGGGSGDRFGARAPARAPGSVNGTGSPPRRF
jgi:lambda family phage portal protein